MSDTAEMTEATEGETNVIDDIIRMSDFTFDRLPMLDIIAERLVDNISAAMLDLTGDSCDVSLFSLDYVPMGQAVEALPKPVLVAVGTGDPFKGEIVLTMDHLMLLTATDLMLGGDAQALNEDPEEFTAIELGFGERIAAALLAELQRALAVVSGASLILDRVDTDTDSATVAKPTSLCVRMKFSVAMAGQVGALDVIIPYDALEPIRQDLAKIYFGNRSEDQSAWQGLITGQIERAHMEMEVVLAEEAIPLRRIMSWQVGETVDFGIEEGKDATMTGVGEPMFKVALGKRSNGFVAVQISERIKTPEESEDDVSNH